MTLARYQVGDNKSGTDSNTKKWGSSRHSIWLRGTKTTQLTKYSESESNWTGSVIIYIYLHITLLLLVGWFRWGTGSTSTTRQENPGPTPWTGPTEENRPHAWTGLWSGPRWWTCPPSITIPFLLKLLNLLFGIFRLPWYLPLSLTSPIRRQNLLLLEPRQLSQQGNK